MAIRADFNGLNEERKSNVIPEGFYEVVVEGHSGVRILPSGDSVVSLKFRVRRDVPGQKYGGWVLWRSFFWHTEKSLKAWNAFNKAVGVIEGTEWENEEVWAEDMIGRPVRAKVIIEKNYKGEDVNSIQFFTPTKYPVNINKVEFMKKATGQASKAQDKVVVDDDIFAPKNDVVFDIADEETPF